MLPFLFAQVVAVAPPSNFWPRVDAVCVELPKALAPDATKLGDAEAAYRELADYCTTKNPPRFAARSEAERIQKLDAIERILGRAPAASSAAWAIPDRRAEVASLIERETRRDGPPELGYLGQKILGAGLGDVCGSPETADVLPSTCKLAEGTPTLVELRSAVVRDLIDLLIKKLDKAAGRDAAPATATTTAIARLRLLALLLEHEDLRAWTDRLPELLPKCTGSASACAAAEKTNRLTVAILARVLRDGPKLDQPSEHYLNVVEEVSREASHQPSLALTEAHKALARSLIVALETLDADRSATPQKNAAEIARDLGFALTKAYVLGAALATSLDASPDQAEGARVFVESATRAIEGLTEALELVTHADARGLFDAVRPLLEDAAPELRATPAQVRALSAAARLAMARSESDLRAVARDAVLPLPAWIDKLILDLNVMPPQSKEIQGSSSLTINSDVTVGYNGSHVGFYVHGDTAYYELKTQNNFALTERYNGAGELWGVIDVSPAVRLDGRITLGGAYYGTLADDNVDGTDRQTNQDSILIRGGGLVGVRANVGARVTVGAWAGAGGQYEDYYRVLQTSAGDQGTTFNAATGLRLDARARFQWTIVPSILSFRARADVDQFTMRRNDQAITYAVGLVTAASQRVVDVSQTEVFARGFLDADVVSFFGFVPAVHGGVNAFFFSSNGQSLSAVVPVFGVGVRREAL